MPKPHKNKALILKKEENIIKINIIYCTVFPHPNYSSAKLKILFIICN